MRAERSNLVVERGLLRRCAPRNDFDGTAQRKPISLLMRWVGVLLSLTMLPYGVATGAQNEAELSRRCAMQEQKSVSVSCMVLSRLGIQAPEIEAANIEEDLTSIELPEARSAKVSWDARTTALLEEIPLGVRTQLLKELASGKEWEAISPEILSQIPMAVAVSIAQENPTDIVCSMPVQTLGLEDLMDEEEFPFGSRSSPYGDAPSTDQAIPAASGAMGKAGIDKNQLACKGVSARHAISRSIDRVSVDPRLRNTRKTQSLYYYVTMMPTGPPEEGEDYLPAQYHYLVNAALHPGTKSLKQLLESSTSTTKRSELISKKRSMSSRRRNVLVHVSPTSTKRGIS